MNLKKKIKQLNEKKTGFSIWIIKLLTYIFLK